MALYFGDLPLKNPSFPQEGPISFSGHDDIRVIDVALPSGQPGSNTISPTHQQPECP